MCIKRWIRLALSASLLAVPALGQAGVEYSLNSQAWLFASAANTTAETHPAAQFSNGQTNAWMQGFGNAGLASYAQGLNLSPSSTPQNGYYAATNSHTLGAWAGYGGGGGGHHAVYQGFSAIEFGAGALEQLHVDFQLSTKYHFQALRDQLGTAANGVPVEFAWATIDYQLFWSALDANGNWVREDDPLLKLDFFGGFQGNNLSEDIIRYDPGDPSDPTHWWGVYIGDIIRTGSGRLELQTNLEGFVLATYDPIVGGGCSDTSAPCTVPESDSGALVLAGLLALAGWARRRPGAQPAEPGAAGCQA